MTPAIAFTATRIRTGEVAAFQRRVVLEPLTGPAADDDQIVENTLRLVETWRARVVELARAGYFNRVPVAATAALNCHPLFIVTPQRARPCGLREACPFCWARRIRSVVPVLDRAFCPPFWSPGTPPTRRRTPVQGIEHRRGANGAGRARWRSRRLPWRDDCDLIEWAASFSIPPWLDDPDTGRRHRGLPVWLSLVTGAWRERAFASIQGVRGVEHVFEVLEQTIEGASPRGTIRRLLVVRTGLEIPEALAPLLEGGQVLRRLTRPTREQVLEVAARAWGYPRALLAHEDVAAVVSLLDEARPFRLKLVRAARQNYGVKDRPAGDRRGLRI